MKPSMLTMLCGAILATSVVSSNAADSTSVSLRDPGVINNERIIYWLKKRGELEQDASEAEIKDALKNYLKNTGQGYTKPKVLVKFEKDAQKRSLKVQGKRSKSMNTTVNVLSVLIDFPDLRYNNNGLSSNDTDMYYSDYNVQHYQDMQFKTTTYDGPSGEQLMTAYQYYQAESGGTFFFTGNTFGWVTADNNAATYGANDANNNDNDVDPESLIVEAVTKAVAQNNIDLSQYDLEDPYDRDGDGNLLEADGFIDHVMVYHSSIGEEAGGGNLGDDAIWSHRFFVNSTGSFSTMGEAVDNSGIKLFGYTIQPIDAAIGVVVHEFGHDLGLADEYDTGESTNGSPVSFWSVMASGSWAGANIPGTEPVGFSPLGRDYFQQKFGGDWVDQVELHVDDLNAGVQDHNMVEAVEHAAVEPNQIKVNLPGRLEDFFPPFTGNYQYYSGQGDSIDNRMSFDVALPAASSISLTMKAHWNIEEDYDYAQVMVNGTALSGNHTRGSNPYHGGVSNYISNQSSVLAGAQGAEGWVDLTFDISSYAGQTVTIEFAYITDTYVKEYGFVADDITITADSSEVVFDGAESDGTVTLNGFSRVGATVEGDAMNYYIQLRSHNGVDVGLNSRNFQPGVVVWLRNEGYSDNKVGEHPGYGFIGVVDAGLNTSTGSNTTQLRDAAFKLLGQNTFRDTTDYSKPNSPEVGLVLPVHGLEMEVTAQGLNDATASIQLRKVPVALTSAFDTLVTQLSVEFINNSYGGQGNLTYAWDFGDGNSSTSVAPTHAYASEGTYTVSLTITDENNDTASSSKDVTVSGAPANLPVAGFSFAVTNLQVSFTNSTTGGEGNLSYSWDFGDGQTSTARSPNHTYTAAGTYSVELTVTDSQNNTDTITRSVTVTAPPSSGGGGSLPWMVLLALGVLTVVRRR